MSSSNENFGSTRQRAKPVRDEEQGFETNSTNTREGISDGVPGREVSEKAVIDTIFPDTEALLLRTWNRFSRTGKKNVPVWISLKRIFFSTWINFLFFLIPLAWVAHFLHWPQGLTFTLSFLAIIPCERMFEFAGDELAIYLGKGLGDLAVITLNNTVEATLALILLERCELRLLQATIVGVVLLHLLLIPGTAFITGGARVWEQDLDTQITQLNHTLLTIGVMTLLLPTAFFAALDRNNAAGTGSLVDDKTRKTFLHISHGLAIILLLVYVASRLFLHNPPGNNSEDPLRLHPLTPADLKTEEARLLKAEPHVNQWILLVALAVNIALLATTAEFLVDSLENVRRSGKIRQEWFGLFILPIVSFSADGLLAVIYFLRTTYSHLMGRPKPAPTIARGEAIDLSIQFTIFWMPFVVLVGWWSSKSFLLLFDFFEVAVLLGSCFLVNYVTADSKTNWAEGFVMVSFYTMIMLTAYFYDGQPEVRLLLACPGSVSEAVAAMASGATE